MLFKRWLRFNAVGVGGIAVQLAVLAGLTRLAGVPYLPATACAVEAAVMHNFAWHQRWTWRDRRFSGRAWLAALARFHLANGLVSIAGNLFLMRLLAGALGLDPILANMAAIAACSLANFFLADRVVFARRPSAASTVARAAACVPETAFLDSSRSGNRE